MENLKNQFDKEISKIEDIDALDKIRILYLGKKGIVNIHMKELSSLADNDKKIKGAEINSFKNYLIDAISKKKEEFTNLEILKKIESEKIDITLPQRHNDEGSIHPVSYVIEEVVNIFSKMGFVCVEGPEIEDDYHNFTALNIADNHPARQMHDTFYFNNQERLLRTHTSSVQIRTMSKNKPPFAIMAPGKAYRSDTDATHTPMFHQIELLYVDKNVSMANLKYCIEEFVREFFGEDVKIRFRSSFFPFTEPSAEVDIECHIGKDNIDFRKGGDFLEILGCGMVHPNVLQEAGIDSKQYKGFALGMGIERIAMLKYGMRDLRQFFNIDYQWLRRFNFKSYI